MLSEIILELPKNILDTKMYMALLTSKITHLNMGILAEGNHTHVLKHT